MDKLFHYTSIETLSLILKYRTVRFNRLDRVDDITEGDSFTELKLEKFFFVSCWTYDQNESLPQWNMYTPNMAGVRLSLPKPMFNFSPFSLPDTIPHIKAGTFFSPIPFEKMFADNYFIPPIFLDEKNFARKVIYSPDYAEIKNQAITFEVKPTGEFKGNISDPTGIAALKSPDWEFQKEYRYILLIFPAPRIEKGPNFFEQFSREIPNFVASSLYNANGPEINYFDLELSQPTINELEITTGPLCTEGDIIAIEALLSKYAPDSVLKRSKFTGTIRRPAKK